jgi:acetoin utilization deacetylase AcuC-like enzyme
MIKIEAPALEEVVMSAGLVYDPVYLRHDTGKHVENSGRLEAILSNLQKTGIISQLVSLSPRPATLAELAAVHDKRHIENIQAVCRSGGGPLDSDTVTSPHSYEAAIYAAGGAMSGVEAVMEGKVDQAFSLVRPPGHHATPNRAMGFCLFNNISIAAKYAISRYALERVAIIDFDVHHGNGTQAAFEADPQVLYISTHQSPLYPGTGHLEETGSAQAMGTKVNIPLPSGCGDSQYSRVYEEIILPVVRRFQPQLILVSAGYDSHWSDNIASMQVSVRGFACLVTYLRGLADELCQNRLMLVLEGGYNLQALAASVNATFEVLLGKKDIADPLGPSPHSLQGPNITHLVQRIKEIHGI